jgi:hypothetical protein
MPILPKRFAKNTGLRILSSTCKVKSGSFIIKAKSTANGKTSRRIKN